MRKIGLFTVMLAVTVIAIPVKAQDSAEVKEPIYIGQGAKVRWSPDGTKISYFSGGWLVVADTSDIAQTTRIGQYRFLKYCWASDSSFLGMERYYNPPDQAWYRVTRIIEVGLDGTQTEIARDSSYLGRPEKGRIGWPTRLPDGTAGYYWEMNQPGKVRSFIPLQTSSRLKKASPWQTGRTAILEVRNGRLMDWTMGDIWLVNAEGEPIKQLTSGQLFCMPQLSPTRDLILASAGGGGLAILDTLGNVVWRPVEHAVALPDGHIAGAESEAWAPDGRQVAYVMTEEDGHLIYGGDIYIASLTDGLIKRVTYTPGTNETDLSWFPHGRRIIFATEGGLLYSVEVGE